GFVCLLIASAALAGTSDWLPLPPEAQAFPRPIRTVTVNCKIGQLVQPAVDANAGPVEIDITGICVENVLIRNKDVMLKGTTKPSLDGIRSADAATPALTIRGTGIDALDSLSFSNSAGCAVLVDGANATVTNCLFENNGKSALQIIAGGRVTATSA